MNSILDKEITTFEEVRKYLSNIPNINFGGCGISALSMYRWLKKDGREVPKIILLYSNYNNYITNKKGIRKESIALKAPLHCAIKYKNKIVDSSRNILEDNFFKQIVEEGETLRLINESDDWAPYFERKYVPRIGEKLGIDLSDVCLNN